MSKINCKHAAELLLDYQDNALDAEHHQQLEGHLGVCPPCKALASTYRATASLCKKVLSSSVPQDIEDRLLGFLRSKIGPKR